MKFLKSMYELKMIWTVQTKVCVANERRIALKIIYPASSSL